MSKVRVGDRVDTSRGAGVAQEVAGPPGHETITVELDSRTVVDFPAAEVSTVVGNDVERIDEFLSESPEDRIAAIDNFLAQPKTEVIEAPEGGRSRGATTLACRCDCGRKGQCYRLHTAPDVHQEISMFCRCEREGCECA